jgi:hypothetical protein
MKVKTLRFKDTKEFVHILEGGVLATASIPDILADTASIETLKEYYEKYLVPFSNSEEINYDNLEVVEFDFIEDGEVGADIRNKLSPPKNLVCLLERYFNDETLVKDLDKLEKYIKNEMEQTKISVEYLSNLF